MDPRDNFGPRLGLGLVIGAAWSLVPAIFLSDQLLACFVAGIPTGIILTWIFTRTSLEHPVIFGTVSLPLSTWLYFTLFSLARLMTATTGGDREFDLEALIFGPFVITMFVLISPLIVFPLLTSLGSTCLLSAVFKKRPPRRRDLLPERWDG